VVPVVVPVALSVVEVALSVVEVALPDPALPVVVPAGTTDPVPGVLPLDPLP